MHHSFSRLSAQEEFRKRLIGDGVVVVGLGRLANTDFFYHNASSGKRPKKDWKRSMRQRGEREKQWVGGDGKEVGVFQTVIQGGK